MARYFNILVGVEVAMYNLNNRLVGVCQQQCDIGSGFLFARSSGHWPLSTALLVCNKYCWSVVRYFGLMSGRLTSAWRGSMLIPHYLFLRPDTFYVRVCIHKPTEE